ncbi:hypothetical protein M9H77_10650 [Catharanthus roseus]|uniref:Uncharacterized protein n=1 Tax=Catharanthus roseus TaxID=4058 RepID=A0ACC0BCC0_CATRO|nr:hypothetical protein M9H77_10650 [Catharanthus roseus]
MEGFDFALNDLEKDMSYPPLNPSRKAEIRMELNFLKMFFRCHQNWEHRENKYLHLASFVSEMTAQKCRSWKSIYYNESLKRAIPEISEISFNFARSSPPRYESCTSDEIHEFLVIIHENLRDLSSFMSHLFVHVKEKIETLQQKVKFFRDLVKFTAERCINHEQQLKDFRVQVQAWANEVACELYVYWAERDSGRRRIPKLEILLVYVLGIKPLTFPVRKVLLGALKASTSLRSEALIVGELVATSVDLLLEDLMASMEDSIKLSLHDGLIMLITFLTNPPLMETSSILLAEVDRVVDAAVSLISSIGTPEEKVGIPSEMYDLVNKIIILKEDIKVNYVRIPDFSLLDFPKTNLQGYIDSLLIHLKEMANSVTFLKHAVIEMWEKLVCVSHYMKELVEKRNEIGELKSLWTRITNGVYAVEYIVDSCLFQDEPAWYKMIALSIYKEEIEFIMKELKKIRDAEYISHIKVHDGVECTNSSPVVFRHYSRSSRINDDPIVGFKEKGIEIIDQITRGSRELKVISLVGMPGQGKTTLAYKVYNDPSVQYRFNKCAWCFVTQVYQRRELLLNILSKVSEKFDKSSNLSEEDLAEKLYKCLKGQKYLIVMDDIWNIKVWDELKESFPNDNNGSRILFTSRIHSIALLTNVASSTHHLCPLTIEESWELLQKKLFYKDSCCPPYLLDVGKRVAKICEGLPLSIVLIAGVLAKRVADLDWWEEVEGNLSSKIFVDLGCMNILELSYNHLPEYLKSCFLYFGAFPQGKPVKVRRLTQLWVSEGFIPNNTGVKRPEDVAMDFLMDLIDRSLVTIAKVTYGVRIKECRIHDLLFDFCLAKAKEDNFLWTLTDSWYNSNMECQEYRLSIHGESSGFFVESQPTRTFYARTLLSDFWVMDSPSFFMKSKFLRIFDSYRSYFSGPHLLRFIPLTHLRHLVLKHLNLDLLPPSMVNLQNLEVLVVGRFEEVFIPDTIWKMKKLRHLDVRSSARFSLGDHSIQSAKLNNVDTLSCPILCGREFREDLLRRFPNVQKLRIKRCIHCTNECCQFPPLDIILPNLVSLHVNGMYIPHDLKFPSRLKKLCLVGRLLPWKKVSVIGKLPHLEILKLYGIVFEEQRWDMEDEEFLNLKFLKLECLNIQEWNTCTDPFPCLQQLVLHNCYLKEIPSSLGEISSLNMIEVRNCSKGAERSAWEILNERLDLGDDGFQVLVSSGICLGDDMGEIEMSTLLEILKINDDCIKNLRLKYIF